jgi:putative transposase
MIAKKESGGLAEKLIVETCAKQGIEKDQLILHSDRAPVSPFVSVEVTPFPAEGGTAQRLTQRSKDQWGQSVTW